MKEIIKIIIVTFTIFTAFVLGFVGIFVCAFKIPSNLFDYLEKLQIMNMYDSRPIMNIVVSDNELSCNSTTFPLLGKYYGLNAGHKYMGCSKVFSGSCYDDIKAGKQLYCPGDKSKKVLLYEFCINNTNIPETNYTIYKSKYLYAEKTMRKIRYETLLTNAISENEQCPNNQKKCGHLNEGLVVCYDLNEACPINDIIFDSNPNHSEGNINYTSLKINDNEYIHFTNEKTDNQIIFDLVLSIEHPLSKIELSEDEEPYMFQLHEKEREMYYIGNIEVIKAFKQLYNTNMTYEDNLKTYNMYDEIMNDAKYKKSMLQSNMFIYKKNPLPFSKYTKNDILDFNNGYHSAYILNYFIDGFLIASFAFIILLIVLGRFRIFFYLGLTLLDVLIILFFSLSIKNLSNSEFFNKDIKSFADKDFHRVQLLVFYSFYFSFAIFENIIGFFIYCQVDPNRKNDKYSDFNYESY